MRSTLFYIPAEVAGLPLFGCGLLLALWIAVCAIRIGWQLYRTGANSQTLKGIAAEVPTMAVVALVFAVVLPAVSEPQGLPIRGYGVMVFLGVVSGVGLAVYRAGQEGYSPDVIFSLALWMCVGGILGARLFYIIEYWDHFQKPTLGETIAAMLNFTRGGLVIYGCFLGGSAAAIAFFLRHRLPVLAFADMIAPSMTLGLALGRIGCFLNGCCFGGQCDLPWAVSFPADSPVYSAQIDRGAMTLHGIRFQQRGADRSAVVEAVAEGSLAAQSGLEPGDRVTALLISPPGDKRFDAINEPTTDGEVASRSLAAVQRALSRVAKAGTKVTFEVVDADGIRRTREWTLSSDVPAPARSLPVHPAQLYSAVDAFVLTFFLMAWYPLRRHAGEVTALMITIYPISRFLQEIIRIDELPVFGTGLSISQNVSLLLLAGAVALWIIVLRGPRLRYAPTEHSGP